MYAVVYPADGSPKKMGPPEAATPGECVVMKPGVDSEAADGGVELVAEEAAFVAVPRGRVSKERVRMQDARMMEKEDGTTGSWDEV